MFDFEQFFGSLWPIFFLLVIDVKLIQLFAQDQWQHGQHWQQWLQRQWRQPIVTLSGNCADIPIFDSSQKKVTSKINIGNSRWLRVHNLLLSYIASFINRSITHLYFHVGVA